MDLFPRMQLGFFVLILAVSAPALAKDEPLKPSPEAAVSCEDYLVKIMADDENHFSGLTERGFERVEKAQASLKRVSKAFAANFEGMNGILEMSLLTMATRENALLLGPPGGAKSKSLIWLIPDLWTKQMHEMMTQAALFGGQTEKGLLDGQEIINRKGSITEAEYAMLDEYTNANPQVSAALLSFMNPGERYYTENGTRVQAATRAVFSSGNATRAEMLKNYAERGLTSGPATLNRSIFKAWVPNWLTLDEQNRRDIFNRRKMHLDSAAKYASPEEREKAKSLLKGLESEKIDMHALEAFAQHAFVPHEDLISAIREYANEFRKSINGKILASEQAFRDNPQTNPLVMTPSAEWTERFRTSLLRVVMYSAALDYLRMANAKDLDPHVFKKPIVLSPMSLWRVMYATTTIGPGENRFNPQTMQIDFNLTRNHRGQLVPMDHALALAGCNSKIQVDELNFMWEEQTLANSIIKGITGRMQAEAKDLAPFKPQTEDMSLELDSQDFEILNYRFLQQTRP
jgi:hypothetical protein